jgi:hypothetical protein
MKKPKNIPTYYKSKGTPIYRDTTALPFLNGGPLVDRTDRGQLLPSVYASALGNYYAQGGMLKRADGSYSPRGLWDNIRDNAGSGKKPTKQMLAQEKKINREYRAGGQFPRPYSLPEDSFMQGGDNLHNSVYASSPAQYPAPYKYGGSFQLPRQQMYMPLDHVERYGGYQKNVYDEGGNIGDPPKDAWGRSLNDKYYGFDPKTKKYTIAPYKIQELRKQAAGVSKYDALERVQPQVASTTKVVSTTPKKEFKKAQERIADDENLARYLEQSGKAELFLGDKYWDQSGDQPLRSMIYDEIRKDPDIMSKIDQKEYERFLKEEQTAYDKATPLQKGANALTAFISDPVLTTQNAIFGNTETGLRRPLVNQKEILNDPDNPMYSMYNRATGADNNWVNWGLNAINPGNWAAQADVANKKGNYVDAYGNLLMNVVGGTGLSELAEQGAKQLPRLANQAGKYLTTQTPLKNAWQYNPLAPKLGAYNRVVGQDAVDDLIESGLVRVNDKAGVANDLGPFGIVNRTTPYPSFAKAKPQQQYIDQVVSQGKTPYVISTDRPMRASNLGRHGKGKTQFPINDEGQYISGFPANEARLYEATPNWLKGYKPVDVPGQLPGSPNAISSADDVGRGFKSEIDWSKWNPDTPKYPELIDEYNTIEKSTKQSGTWMKNSDGSPFQGTPEQFVQQQSSWFKKSGLDNEFLYHSTKNDFDKFTFDKFNSNSQSQTKKIPATYLTNNKLVAEDFLFGEPGKVMQIYSGGKSKIIDNIPNFTKSKLNIQEIKDSGVDKFIIKNTLDVNIPAALKRVIEGVGNKQYKSDIHGVFNNQMLKSTVGNVGFFDMTNPNIYKALFPAAVATGAGLLQNNTETQNP